MYPFKPYALSAQVFLLLCLASCSDSDGSSQGGISTSQAPAILTAPVFQASARVPLAGVITLQTDVPTSVSLSVDDGVETWQIPDAEPQFQTDHEVMALGFLSDRTHTITVVVTDQQGNQTTAASPVVFQTPPLPADFPPIEVDVVEPTLMEPGYTLFGTSGTSVYSIILDAQGRSVWYLEGVAGHPHRMRNGNLLIEEDGVHTEFDMLGNVIQQWYASALDGGAGAPAGATLVHTDRFHHEFSELPLGMDADFVALSSEIRELPDYPASEEDLSVTEPVGRVVGDVILEFQRDGTIVRETKLLDILDPYRIGFFSLILPFYNGTYGTSPTRPRDWSHGNSMMYDEKDNAYIVSVRHLDCIVKIDRETGELLWILGNPDHWKEPWASKLLSPVGVQFEWQYKQHAAFLTDSGTLTCFDNGNLRSSPPVRVDSTYSRAVEFRIDPVAMTVEQVWAAGGMFDPEPNRLGLGTSNIVGNVQTQPQTGNVLITAGALRGPDGRMFTRILEVSRTLPPFTIAEIELAMSSPWVVYRAYRIKSLYPD